MSITKVEGKRKNGLQCYRVRIRYATPAGEKKQIERTAWGKAEAQAMEARLIAERAGGALRQRMTMNDLFELYMADKKMNVRESTIEKCRKILQHSTLPFLGNVRLDKIDASVLTKWKEQNNSDELSISTKRNRYQELNAMLNFAVKRGYIGINPLKIVGNFKEPYFEMQQEKLHYYTPDQYLRYADAARAYAESKNTVQAWGYFVFFQIAFYTGARKGEINALRWSDLDGDILHIRRSVCQKLKGGDRITPPKNKSSYRDLQLPRVLMLDLVEHRCRQHADARYTDDWFICGGPVCLRDTTLEKYNTRFATTADVPHLRIHDFRHTHASVLINAGINIKEIARRLGHSTVDQTWNTYSHLYPKEQERAVAIFDRIGQR